MVAITRSKKSEPKKKPEPDPVIYCPFLMAAVLLKYKTVGTAEMLSGQCLSACALNIGPCAFGIMGSYIETYVLNRL
jgi:hypothetical protein